MQNQNMQTSLLHVWYTRTEGAISFVPFVYACKILLINSETTPLTLTVEELVIRLAGNAHI